jgi:hypothetical protein
MPGLGCFSQPFRLESVAVTTVCEKPFAEKRAAAKNSMVRFIWFIVLFAKVEIGICIQGYLQLIMAVKCNTGITCINAPIA